jgi:hypothetical protein
VPINASIAVLAADSVLASAVAHRLQGHSGFSAQVNGKDNSADPSITFGESIRLSSIPAQPDLFDPPRLGSFLAWGADIALLVVDSSIGLDGASIQRAQEVAQHHPLMVAVTGLNSPRANFDETLAVISRVMDQRHHAVAITLPVLQDSESIEDSEVGGILDLVNLEIRILSSEGEQETHDLEQGHYDLIEAHLEALTNAVVVTSTDEDLIHSVLEHGFDSADQLREQLLSATARREIIPVFALADSIGVAELADFALNLKIEAWLPQQVGQVECLATALGNNGVRIWQGQFRSGTYFADDTEIAITEMYDTNGETMTRALSGEIVKIQSSQELRPGCSISLVKSSPLAVDHAFE